MDLPEVSASCWDFEHDPMQHVRFLQLHFESFAAIGIPYCKERQYGYVVGHCGILQHTNHLHFY